MPNVFCITNCCSTCSWVRGRQVLGHRLGKMNVDRGMDPPKITFLMDRKPLTTFGDQHQKTPTKGLEDHRTGCTSLAQMTMTYALISYRVV